MKVVFCGSRNWNREDLIEDELKRLQRKHGTSLEVIHGAHWKGADKFTSILCKKLGIKQVPVPAEWKKQKKAAGPIRNEKMAKMKPELVLAFCNKIRSSPGTANMVLTACDYKINIEIISEESVNV